MNAPESLNVKKNASHFRLHVYIFRDNDQPRDDARRPARPRSAWTSPFLTARGWDRAQINPSI